MEDGSAMIRILYEDNHLLGVEKPANMRVNSDSSNDPDLLSELKQYLKETYHKPGNVYLGLVHRLDRPVGGAMIFAKTSKAASRLSDQVRRHAMKKTYYAILDGIPKEEEGTLVDWLVKDPSSNMVKVTDEAHGKRSVLHYKLLGERNGRSLVQIELETGRPHQIRVQFSSRGLPLVSDHRYHPNPEHGQIALWAVRLEFPHPVSKEPVILTCLPPEEGEWNHFKDCYGIEEKETQKIPAGASLE